MHPRSFVVVALALAAVACVKQEGKAPQVVRPAYLSGVPVIHGYVVQDTTGTADYQHVLYLAPVPVDSAAAFYRQQLAARKWLLMADHGDTARVTQYWQKDSLSLWVQIRAGGLACQVSLTAAGSGSPSAPGTAGQPRRR